MNEFAIPISDVLASEIATVPVEEDLEVEIPSEPTDNKATIAVDLLRDVEAVEVPEIVDTHGRLSDIIESIEEELGVSVVPLRMANIAPEVVRLQRHEIFTFAGERYAFSCKIRQAVCERYVDEIIANISHGVPFTLDLFTSIMYNGIQFNTLLLSRVEWTYIMSRCRMFKQSLTTDKKSQITLTVLAERV